MRTKKIIMFFLIIIVVLVSYKNYSYARTTEQGLKYTIDNNEITITGYDESLSGYHIVIPEEIEGYKVTKIGDNAFENYVSLNYISIPEGVTSIGENAFYNCSNLFVVGMPTTVKNIGKGAFSYTEISNIYIPEGVEEISDYTFSSCDNLRSICLPKSVKSIGKGAFYFCDLLSEVELHNNITSIGERAFWGCEFSTINIPTGITTIENNTFQDCDCLDNVTIPKNVTTIGEKAFYSCDSLSKMFFEGDIDSVGSDAFRVNRFGDAKVTLYVEENTQILSYAKSYRFNYVLTNLKGLEHVINDGEAIIIGCDKNVSGIIIPETIEGYPVTIIAEEAFSECSLLKNIQIPNTVVSIKKDAFYKCNSLEYIHIPSSVTSIENYAFSSCDKLSKVTFDRDLNLNENKIFDESYNVIIHCKSKDIQIINYAKNNKLKYIITDLVGDIDVDGIVTSFDAYIALEKSLDTTEKSEDELYRLDIDKDGEVTSFDAYKILEYSVGIIDGNYWK